MTASTPIPCGCPLRHEHGTRRMYDAHACRCTPCRVRNAAKQYAWRNHTPLPSSDRWIDPTGSVRRLQALAAIGIPRAVIAERLGVSIRHVQALRDGVHKRMRRDTAQRIADVYEQLWDAPPDMRSENTRRQAARHGYLPPLAWDDIDTDPEPPAPDDDPVIDHVLVDRIIAGTTRLPKGSRAPERAVAVRRLAAYGLTDAEIARRVGITQWNAQKVRERNGIEPARPSGRAA